LLQLDIVVGTTILKDSFEWPLFGAESPESFAEKLCTELGLTGEFL
jgi:hypothetical protein